MIPNDHRTEADAILEWADQHRSDLPEYYDDDVRTLVIPPGHSVHTLDPEPINGTPRRTAGTIHVHDSASFVAAVNHRADQEGNPPVVVYADITNLGLCAVLNDDHLDSPGWRDHRVVMRIEQTPAWRHWENGQGLVEQEVFATHIEDGEQEIVEPSAATMLEIAQTFHAASHAKFKSGIRTSSGARQFVYEEDTDTKAGTAGTLEVPEEFMLALAPFEGSGAYKVKARLQYRLVRGDFRIGYKLVRPVDVVRDAFRARINTVAEGLPDGCLMLAGPAPSNAGPTGTVKISTRIG